MKKYSFIVVLAAGLIVSVFGCGSSGNIDEKTEVQSNGVTEAEQKKSEENKKSGEPDEKDKSTSTAEAVSQKEKKDELKVTFIELGSVKCVPCRKMQPIMDEIEEEYPNQVKVVFYDVWTEQGRPYAKEYGIRVIPTQVFLDKNGKEYYRHEGFFPKEELVKVLKMQGVE